MAFVASPLTLQAYKRAIPLCSLSVQQLHVFRSAWKKSPSHSAAGLCSVGGGGGRGRRSAALLLPVLRLTWAAGRSALQSEMTSRNRRTRFKEDSSASGTFARFPVGHRVHLQGAAQRGRKELKKHQRGGRVN